MASTWPPSSSRTAQTKPHRTTTRRAVAFAPRPNQEVVDELAPIGSHGDANAAGERPCPASVADCRAFSGNPYLWAMAPSARRIFSFGRRVLTCAAIGFACGAIAGVLMVLVAWFPGAMATFAENPHFVDPRSTLLLWCAMWALVPGSVGALIGFGVGAIPTTGPDSGDLSGASLK